MIAICRWQKSWNVLSASSMTNAARPKLILTSEELPDRKLLGEALGLRAEHKIEISAPQRGEKREIMDRALANAREQLGRRMAENSAQTQLLEGVAELFGMERRHVASRSMTIPIFRAPMPLAPSSWRAPKVSKKTSTANSISNPKNLSPATITP